MKHCQRLFRNNLFIQIAFIIFVLVQIELALAAPTGGRVVQGMVSVTYNPPVIRIVQQTEDAVVLWRSFDLAVGERLEIVQPSQKSRLINQVTNGGLSDIRGNIETAACGAAVVCSDIKVFREIMGDDAYYFDPENVQDIAASLETAIEAAQPKRMDIERFRWSSITQRLFKEMTARTVTKPGIVNS